MEEINAIFMRRGKEKKRDEDSYGDYDGNNLAEDYNYNLSDSDDEHRKDPTLHLDEDPDDYQEYLGLKNRKEL